jgi:hypothetical protein
MAVGTEAICARQNADSVTKQADPVDQVSTLWTR